jgi:predicted amino acid-binding ACT domain protein
MTFLRPPTIYGRSLKKFVVNKTGGETSQNDGKSFKTKFAKYTTLRPGRSWNFGILKNMKNHYLLWATGQDHPGFVAEVTKLLFELHCNLEDSSMMRLGAEFAMFVIFTSDRELHLENFSSLNDGPDVSVGLKKISNPSSGTSPDSKWRSCSP